MAPLVHQRLATAALVLSSLLAGAACNLQFSTGVEAKEAWTRNYKVSAGATVELRETNGRIHVAAADGDEVLVSATRIAKAGSEEAAKAALADVVIRENATADRIELDSVTPGLGLTLGRSHRVDYDVKMPRTASLVIKTTNGEIEITSIAGFVRVETVNGDISATGLEQGAEVTAVNGRVRLGFAKIGEGGVRCKTTNGQIVVTVPSDAKANIAARVVNGVVRTDNLQVSATEESRRRLDATLGGGGPEIRLDTTNGEIRLVGR